MFYKLLSCCIILVRGNVHTVLAKLIVRVFPNTRRFAHAQPYKFLTATWVTLTRVTLGPVGSRTPLHDGQVVFAASSRYGDARTRMVRGGIE